jgi:hypothetical protein
MSLHAMFVGEPPWEAIGLGKQGNWTHWSLLMRLSSQNTEKMSGSQKLPSLEITSIKPSFFLLPLRQSEKLGVLIYEERLSKQKQGALQIGNWKDDEWPPERIIQYYGPATWQKMGPGAVAPVYICSATSSGCSLLLKL